MICGKRFVTLLLGLGFLGSALLGFSSESVPDYLGPDLPTGWYPVHESELSELERQINELKNLLSAAENDLKEAESDNAMLRRRISVLTESLSESEAEITRSRWYGRLEGAAVAIVVREGVGLVLTLRR